MFWLEFTVGLSEDYQQQIKPLWKEGDELLAIIVSSIITAKQNNNKDRDLGKNQSKSQNNKK